MGFAGRGDVVVLALPRGGAVVGYEVAQALNAPLDVFVVRKLGTPGQPELAMGAIASGGVIVLNPDVVHALNIPDEVIREVAAREEQEVERREREYRGNRPPLPLRRQAAILVDDGLATGSTMRAAVSAVRDRDPGAIVVAVPVHARALSGSRAVVRGISPGQRSGSTGVAGTQRRRGAPTADGMRL